MRTCINNLVAVGLWLAASWCAADSSALAPQKIAGFDQAAVAAGVNFSAFTKVLVEAPQVAFERQWLRDHSQDISLQDQQKLATQYAQELQNRLNKQLATATHLAPTEQADAQTLVIRPSLDSLVINGPELSTAGRRDVYVRTAGRASVQLELRDGSSGQLLASFKDAGETSEKFAGKLLKTDRVQNLMDFRRLMDHWGRSLGHFLQPEP